MSRLLLMCWTFVLWIKLADSVARRASTTKNQDNSVCQHGKLVEKIKKIKQSPINIITEKTISNINFPRLYCHYSYPFSSSTATIKNTGTTISVKLTNDALDVPKIYGGPLFDCTYEFLQMHFHWNSDDFGSEHEFDGQKYAMEIHLVHYKKIYGSFTNAQKYNDGICVVAVFGKISEEDNPAVTHFTNDLKNLKEINSVIVRDFQVEFPWMVNIASGQHYYSYYGSLTTKPFTQCVIWILFTQTFDISRTQLNEFRKLHSDETHLIQENDRKIQKINKRVVVYVYDSTSK